MAVDWKTAGTRGIPTPNPFTSPGLTPSSPFMQPGVIPTNLVPLSFANSGAFGAYGVPYGTPYGPTLLDPISSGYGFTPYGVSSFANPYGATIPFGGMIPNPYPMGFQASDHLSDQDLERLVEDILGLDPLTCNADIQVECRDQVVILTGTVTSRLVKIAAGNDAWMVVGVRDVDNSIQIKSRSHQGQKQRQTAGASSR